MAVDKISSYDTGYAPGDLSVYPLGIDNYETLYEAKNLSRTRLKAAISYISDIIVVEDTTNFPDKGILRLYLPDKKGFDAELVYYDKKTRDTFQNLKRGFCSSRQNSWPGETIVDSGVFAEHHNALKDAVLQIETFLGVSSSTDEATLTGLLKKQENRFLSPTPTFRAYPLKGQFPLTVTFQNFSSTTNTRYFWDFGDGGTSYERSPHHTYLREGTFTVQLRVVSMTGGQGVATKNNYITISNEFIYPFAYISPNIGYSAETAASLSIAPTNFTFIDQTDASITSRLWQFDDGQTVLYDDGNIHTANHIYDKPGDYKPSVLITYQSDTVSRALFQDTLKVL
jgi:hypothetical protein